MINDVNCDVVDERFDVLKAVELLASSEEWQWTNNSLIIDLVWPALQEWAGRGQPQADRTYIANILQFLGQCSQHFKI